MNKNWKSYWKLLANEKRNTALFHFQYCILKALGAKSNAKKEIAQALIRRAFTPKGGSWDAINRIGHKAFWSHKIFGLDTTLFFDEGGLNACKELIKEVLGDKFNFNEPDYMFIFVRQDISQEQQAVQAAHATYCAGVKFAPKEPEETHFVLVGVENEEALNEISEFLTSKGTEFVSFVEPDLANSITAIATERMKENQKRFLRRYKKLEFNK